LSNVQTFGGRGAGVVRGFLISEESARQDDPGAVEALGAHDELLVQKGRYAELFELQAAGYR
jgi:hypothetical protein